jgi:2,3,4,5-tetrahydropyridine-2-carboxylate N-succinyltransferase
MDLKQRIERLYNQDPGSVERQGALQLFNEFKFFLNRGEIRVAEELGDGWRVHVWVKKGILLGLRMGEPVERPINGDIRYFEKSTYPLKDLSLESGVQIARGGSAVRDGVYMGRDVVCMPPMYIDVGAYVGAGTQIGSHVLVGACAQIGNGVFVGAGTQIGGVLDPVDALPVILEDRVRVEGNCGIFDGVVIKRDATIGPGVVLAGETEVYDLVRKAVYRREGGRSLIIPEGAVVVSGSRGIDAPWPVAERLSMMTPLIVRYAAHSSGADPLLGQEEH